MLFVATVKESVRTIEPPGYEQMDLFKKLYHSRSAVPAVTHLDYSARVQTVAQKSNPLFSQLIHHFKAITGCPMLINTSFNQRGEPIVCTPEEAYRCFMQTGMDYLVIGHYSFAKDAQPLFKEARQSFEPD
jgi:carbamoyltransferase